MILDLGNQNLGNCVHSKQLKKIKINKVFKVQITDGEQNSKIEITLTFHTWISHQSNRTNKD